MLLVCRYFLRCRKYANPTLYCWYTTLYLAWAGLTNLPGGYIYSLDWTTGLTFDPKILARNGHFALVGVPRMLPCHISGWEDTYDPCTCSEAAYSVLTLVIKINLASECTACTTLLYIEVRTLLLSCTCKAGHVGLKEWILGNYNAKECLARVRSKKKKDFSLWCYS